MLMGAHYGAVDHRIFLVGVGRQMLKDPLPDALCRPAAEAPMDVFPAAEPFGQVTPRHTCAVSKEYPSTNKRLSAAVTPR